MGDVDVRQNILEEATRLFARRGYGSTSVREVVEAAGVTKPTLYYYFGSKEQLFREAVSTQMAVATELIREVLDRQGSVQERILDFVERYIREALENPDAVRLLMTVQQPVHTPGQPRIDLMGVHWRHLEMLQELLAQGVAAGELRADLDVAHTVVCLIGMANVHCMAGLYDLPLPEDYAQRILDLFLNGVGQP